MIKLMREAVMTGFKEAMAMTQFSEAMAMTP
ncbi:hypothetical protein LAX5112_05015 [Roseibium alexandrii]|uniref:Uncharacterized protein n=1 Tax=Roseibium alexandrii TaxID=388408 RepID=A0A0M7ARD8_9HYPH|nr:hypothetical protein LAX5112_05015 [Roseibium alexandrii]